VFGLVVFSWSRCEQVGCAMDPLLETARATATSAPVCPSGSDYEFLKLTRLPPDAVIRSTVISGLPGRRPHPLPRPPPPASPGTPPTSRGRVPSSLGPLPRLRRVLPRLRGGEFPPPSAPSPGFAGYSPDFAGESSLLPRPPPPASPGTPPTSRGRVPSSLGPLPRLRPVFPRHPTPLSRLRGATGESLPPPASGLRGRRPRPPPVPG